MNATRLILPLCLWIPFATAPAFADVVLDWNNAALSAIRADRTSPPKASRALAIAHLAIHDAAQGVQRTHRPYYVSSLAPVGASLEAAVAAAGFTALSALFANPQIQATNLQARYQAQLVAIPDGPAKSDGLAWGAQVAQAILSLRAGDGSTNVVSYTPGTEPGQWRPTPPANAPALLPSWASLVPFGMMRSDQFQPQTPPPVASSAYSFEFNTVKLFGGSSSTLRSADQTQVALFWADGAGTATPPGHWNVIAQSAASAQGNSTLQNARLFALLNLALADAAIVAWNCKYTYHYWRPITAIREAATDGNPDTDADPAWTSLIVTPPFPEYSSGHSTFSRSAATVLAGFFGTDAVSFTSTSDDLPGVTRSYTSFSTAADESGISRLYGGIHWPSGNLHAQACGHQLGAHVLAYFLQPLTAPQFTSIRRAGASTQIELVGEPSRAYVIRVSSDLKTWESIATVSSAEGLIRFADVNAGTAQLRFYQAVAQ